MPRKYKITYPDKCINCNNKDTCSFNEVTAHGILLDCKAFYLVFCELEERCYVPFDNPEKMELHIDQYLAGKNDFLHPALVTNGILAAELAMKYLAFIEEGTFDCTHEIDHLYYALPNIHKDALSDLLKAKTYQNDDTLRLNLKQIRNHFVDWRYFFEKGSIGYNSFMTQFIHIICDYTIEISESIDNI